ncbi:MAG: tyrosine-protein phosphatase [Acidimicrobiia bacterium]|nr:tyrosine-protein phosphatase [Acidimicrobiia bacterium]
MTSAAERNLDWDGLVATQRNLDWDGPVGGRDLAGLAVAGGGRIARGRLVRSASPHLGVDHDQMVADRWRTFDRAEPLEVAFGMQPSPRPPLAQVDHHQSLGGLLADHPGARCFADPDLAGVVRARLLGRLIA